jgi:hypothetical protein
MVKLTLKDDVPQTPEVTEWLKECERKINSHLETRRNDFLAFGSIEIPTVDE